MSAASVDNARDFKVITLIGVSHYLSHVYHLALPTMFPLIHKTEGISYIDLGVLTSVFFLTSGLGQTPAGFLVDKIGARPSLFAGMALLAGSTTLFALTNNYTLMLFLSFLGGLGNSVFHPADFSLLNGSVSKARIGRGFGIHGFGGFLGYATTPFCVFIMGNLIGWQKTMLLVGCLGLCVLAVMIACRRDLRDSGKDVGASPQSFKDDINVLLKPASIFSFTFFCFMAMGSVGLMAFGASALTQIFGFTGEVASSVITLQLTGSLIGILVGGWVADRIVRRHDIATAAVVTLGVAFLLCVPAFKPASYVVLVGLMMCYGALYGMANPLRDMVIRSFAPTGGAGKVFGFTYSGMDFGSSMSALIFGYLLEQREPELIFILVGVFMMIGVGAVLVAKATSPSKAVAAAA
ncbi:MAG: FSR family fosmidomycin resistance protein-like MFS transporter [Alphaproteobacteria bacterium]|jgi:FSR family fosmidomycin resistance protein-like MFS transporter